MNKELMKEVNKFEEETCGKSVGFKTICFMILKTLELKDKGLTSEDFKVEKYEFN